MTQHSNIIMAGMGMGYGRYSNDPESIVSTVVIVLFLSDFTLGTLLYIVGGHNVKKNRSLLRAYYLYSAGLCILSILLTGMLIGMSAQRWFTLNISMRTLTMRILDFSGYFVNIALQGYFVLLLRSEIMNPNGSTLKNQGAESEYMIQYKDEEAGEKEIEYSKMDKNYPKLNKEYSKLDKEYMNQIWQL